MFGLPLDTDLDQLVGTRLTFVGAGTAQLQLAFSGDVACHLSIEGDFTVRLGADGPARTYGDDDHLEGCAAAVRLLDRVVVGAHCREGGTVALDLDDGSGVAVHDSNRQHESYQLHLGQRLLVV